MVGGGQVPSRLLDHVRRDEQFVPARCRHTPQGFQPRAPVGGREQNVGVQEDPHVSSSTWTSVRDTLGVEPQGFDLFDRPCIPRGIKRVREQEFRLSFRRVHFYWNRNRGSDQNPIGLRFCNNKGPFADSVPAAEVCGDDHRAALSDPYRFHIGRLSAFQTFSQGALGHFAVIDDRNADAGDPGKHHTANSLRDLRTILRVSHPPPGRPRSPGSVMAAGSRMVFNCSADSPLVWAISRMVLPVRAASLAISAAAS